MTMHSRDGLIFGIINSIGNFGAVFVDESYFTATIASRPSASWKSYLLGGALWFSIPFAIATSIGLASRAVGLPLSDNEAARGLVAPAVVIHFLGVNGAYLIALIVLLAVTSALEVDFVAVEPLITRSTGTLNQELMAVSKLISYDFYRAYWKPNATGTQILKITRATMIIFGLLMGVLAILLTRVGVTLEFVYYFMGIAIAGAVPPIYFCVNWNKASSKGAIAGAITGKWFSIFIHSPNLAFLTLNWQAVCAASSHG